MRTADTTLIAKPGDRFIRVIIPGAGSVEIDTHIVEGATGDKVIHAEILPAAPSLTPGVHWRHHVNGTGYASIVARPLPATQGT